MTPDPPDPSRNEQNHDGGRRRLERILWLRTAVSIVELAVGLWSSEADDGPTSSVGVIPTELAVHLLRVLLGVRG